MTVECLFVFCNCKSYLNCLRYYFDKMKLLNIILLIVNAVIYSGKRHY